MCWVTGQGTAGGGVGAADVDGGTTTLLSPVFDLSAMTRPTVSYWRWYSNDEGSSPSADTFVVDITGNGTTWVNVESVGPTGVEASGSWFYHEFLAGDLVSLTSTVQLRFVASDLGAGSIVEAAIDDLQIRDLECAASAVTFRRGDCNDSGAFDLADPLTLLAVLFSGTAMGGCPDACEINDDGGLNIADVVYGLVYLFEGGQAPPAPFAACGDDATGGDPYDCDSFGACP
jgi:hypothetical protein